MAKYANDLLLDLPLDYIKNNCDKVVVNDGQPADYNDANTTRNLAEVAVTAVDFTGPADDVSGRKLTVNAQQAIPVTADGTADHVSLLDVNNTALLYVTTIANPQAVVTGNDIDLGAWDINFQDPT